MTEEIGPRDSSKSVRLGKDQKRDLIITFFGNRLAAKIQASSKLLEAVGSAGCKVFSTKRTFLRY